MLPYFFVSMATHKTPSFEFRLAVIETQKENDCLTKYITKGKKCQQYLSDKNKDIYPLLRVCLHIFLQYMLIIEYIF